MDTFGPTTLPSRSVVNNKIEFNVENIEIIPTTTTVLPEQDDDFFKNPKLDFPTIIKNKKRPNAIDEKFDVMELQTTSLPVELKNNNTTIGPNKSIVLTTLPTEMASTSMRSLLINGNDMNEMSTSSMEPRNSNDMEITTTSTIENAKQTEMDSMTTVSSINGNPINDLSNEVVKPSEKENKITTTSVPPKEIWTIAIERPTPTIIIPYKEDTTTGMQDVTTSAADISPIIVTAEPSVNDNSNNIVESSTILTNMDKFSTSQTLENTGNISNYVNGSNDDDRLIMNDKTTKTPASTLYLEFTTTPNIIPTKASEVTSVNKQNEISLTVASSDDIKSTVGTLNIVESIPPSTIQIYNNLPEVTTTINSLTDIPKDKLPESLKPTLLPNIEPSPVENEIIPAANITANTNDEKSTEQENIMSNKVESTEPTTTQKAIPEEITTIFNHQNKIDSQTNNPMENENTNSEIISTPNIELTSMPTTASTMLNLFKETTTMMQIIENEKTTEMISTLYHLDTTNKPNEINKVSSAEITMTPTNTETITLPNKDVNKTTEMLTTVTHLNQTEKPLDLEIKPEATTIKTEITTHSEESNDVVTTVKPVNLEHITETQTSTLNLNKNFEQTTKDQITMMTTEAITESTKTSMTASSTTLITTLGAVIDTTNRPIMLNQLISQNLELMNNKEPMQHSIEETTTHSMTLPENLPTELLSIGHSTTVINNIINNDAEDVFTFSKQPFTSKFTEQPTTSSSMMSKDDDGRPTMTTMNMSTQKNSDDKIMTTTSNNNMMTHSATHTVTSTQKQTTTNKPKSSNDEKLSASKKGMENSANVLSIATSVLFVLVGILFV